MMDGGDATAQAVGDALARVYPDARCELLARDPWELLVAAILSARSTDFQVNRVMAVPSTSTMSARPPMPPSTTATSSGWSAMSCCSARRRAPSSRRRARWCASRLAGAEGRIRSPAPCPGSGGARPRRWVRQCLRHPRHRRRCPCPAHRPARLGWSLPSIPRRPRPRSPRASRCSSGCAQHQLIRLGRDCCRRPRCAARAARCQPSAPGQVVEGRAPGAAPAALTPAVGRGPSPLPSPPCPASSPGHIQGPLDQEPHRPGARWANTRRCARPAPTSPAAALSTRSTPCTSIPTSRPTTASAAAPMATPSRCCARRSAKPCRRHRVAGQARRDLDRLPEPGQGSACPACQGRTGRAPRDGRVRHPLLRAVLGILDGAQARAYLASRALGEAVCRRFRLGWPGSGRLVDEARRKASPRSCCSPPISRGSRRPHRRPLLGARDVPDRRPLRQPHRLLRPPAAGSREEAPRPRGAGGKYVNNTDTASTTRATRYSTSTARAWPTASATA